MARTLTNEIITAAIDGYEAQKARIDAKIAELQGMLPGSSLISDGAAAPAKSRRRRMSAAGRARIAAAQKKRWAASRGQSEAVTHEPPKRKRRLSRAGKAAIVAALKKRWAATKAEAAKPPSGSKKAASARKKKTVRKAAKQLTPAPANAQAGA